MADFNKMFMGIIIMSAIVGGLFFYGIIELLSYLINHYEIVKK